MVLGHIGGRNYLDSRAKGSTAAVGLLMKGDF
jgi:hypothetical protein